MQARSNIDIDPSSQVKWVKSGNRAENNSSQQILRINGDLLGEIIKSFWSWNKWVD